MRKIAFWRSVAAGYVGALAQPRRFLQVAGPWIAAFAALLALGVAVEAALPTAATQAAFGVTLVLLVVAGYNAFAVAWYRWLLLGEARPFGENLRFGRRELRFVGYSLAAILVLALPAL